MKNIIKKFMLAGFFSLLFTGVVIAQTAINKPLNIKGKVAILNPEMFKKYNMVWLYKGIGRSRKAVDSVAVNADGSFAMTVKAPATGLYSVVILKWQTAAFWSDKDVFINARGYDTARVKLKNSSYVAVESKSAATKLISTAAYNQFLADREEAVLNDESFAAQKVFAKDPTWLNYLRTNGLVKTKSENETMRLKQLIVNNEGNPAIVHLLSMFPAEKESKFFEENLLKLITAHPQLAEAKQLKKEYLEKLALRNSLKNGSEIPSIVYNDPEGKPIDIKSFKGKYVLVDFWASWCGPCRKAIPEIKELYAQYKAKGFEVLSVSVDTDNAAWRKAMAEEAMPWAQVLSPDKNKTLSDFMILGIPTLFIVDREGKIVDKHTGFSSKLKTQLADIFKDKI